MIFAGKEEVPPDHIVNGHPLLQDREEPVRLGRDELDQKRINETRIGFLEADDGSWSSPTRILPRLCDAFLERVNAAGPRRNIEARIRSFVLDFNHRQPVDQTTCIPRAGLGVKGCPLSTGSPERLHGHRPWLDYQAGLRGSGAAIWRSPRETSGHSACEGRGDRHQGSLLTLAFRTPPELR